MGNDYEIKISGRIERYLRLAERAREEAARYRGMADKISGLIPLGQPILVGHHSERRHRRDLDRIQRWYRKQIELNQEADEYERKAKAAEESHSVSSDDPEAVAKLKEKLASLEAKQESMKQANKLFKAGGWEALAGLLDPEEIKDCKRYFQFSQSQVPYPSFALQNNNGNMARIRQRIEQLKQRPAEKTQEEIKGDGFRVVECPDDNRIRIYFDSVPSPEIRGILKHNGWRWSPTAGAWQRQLNANGRNSAEHVISRLEGTISTGEGDRSGLENFS